MSKKSSSNKKQEIAFFISFSGEMSDGEKKGIIAGMEGVAENLIYSLPEHIEIQMKRLSNEKN